MSGTAVAACNAGSAQPASSKKVRAIEAIDIEKEYPTHLGVRRVLDGVNFTVGEGERLAILGRNGAGKSTLIRLLAGIEQPTSGMIRRDLFMSWPLALSGGFEGEISGYDNIRFISRVYNVPFRETFEYIADFTELGPLLFVPVRLYSSGMRARLAFALSLAINFECFLIDEVILVGDQKFQQKCFDELFGKRKHCAMIMAIHAPHMVQEYCSACLVLKDGRGRVFYDTKLATDIYATL